MVPEAWQASFSVGKWQVGVWGLPPRQPPPGPRDAFAAAPDRAAGAKMQQGCAQPPLSFSLLVLDFHVFFQVLTPVQYETQGIANSFCLLIVFVLLQGHRLWCGRCWVSQYLQNTWTQFAVRKDPSQNWNVEWDVCALKCVLLELRVSLRNDDYLPSLTTCTTQWTSQFHFQKAVAYVLKDILWQWRWCVVTSPAQLCTVGAKVHLQQQTVWHV